MADDDTLRFQHYEVARLPDGSPHLLGSGAMGTTYRALDTNLRVPVALKVINATYLQDEDARHRFLREARAAAQLRHPNVAAVYHLGRADDNSYFYAMELVEGETFSALVRREGQLAPIFTLELTLQAARALAAAHERGLIHRDIKPANLMLYYLHGEPVVKVIDFGLAKAIDAGEGGAASGPGGSLDECIGQLTRTEVGGFRGTPNYASPEQLEELPVDTRSDIYSLGITLWFMLAGQPPFTGTSLARIVTQQLSRSPPFEQIAHAPEPVRTLLARMLAKDPAGRPQNPLALRDEILACLRELSAAPPPPTPAAAVSLTPSTPAMLVPGSSRVQAAAASGSKSDVDLAATHLGPPPGGVLAPGALLGGGRYRIAARLGAEDFAGDDTATKQGIVVRALPHGLSISARHRIASVAEQLRDADHPHVLLLHDFFIPESETDPGYLILDETVGSDRTLRQLLTRRGGALTLPETLAVLTPAAEGITALAERGVTSADLRAAHVFLPDAEFSAPDAVLTTGLLIGPTEFFPARSLLHDDQTLVDDGEDFAHSADGGTRALGWLAYEMLGGSPRQVDTGRYSPLAVLDEAGNAVLRRCCTGETDGEQGAVAATKYRDAQEFVAALRAASGLAATEPAPDAAAPAMPFEPSGSHRHRAWSLAQVVLFLVLIDAAALGVWYGWKHYQPTPQIAAEVPTSPRALAAPPPASAAPSVATPFRADTPWENSLGMKFVPVAVGNAAPLLASIWATRVQDFTAFVEATGYDATGGLYALGDDGRRRQETGRSWRDPGFTQGLTHPVIGVNFGDANAFCAWLTQREQAAGVLPRSHRYRLPTDAEWSQLAGLREEENSRATPLPDNALPEFLSERATDIFPWGKTWPPPVASPAPGNYAGAELTALPAADRLADYRDGFPRTAPVGSFPPNALGLYDCGGNVWQWCADRFKAGADWRTVRGGSWLSSARAQLRLGARQGYAPSFRHDDIGFRCVLDSQP